MSRTTVVNVKDVECDVYIGRAMPGRMASRFGNPFRIGRDGDRAAVLSKYREHLAHLLSSDPSAAVELQRLKGLRLGCWCAPLPCHGDILVELLEGPPAPATPPDQLALF